MPSICDNIAAIRRTIPAGVTLLCVSKYHPEDAILQAYQAGERDFGESHVQELVRKAEALPRDIRWHMIGHLQTNKVRALMPYVSLIESVDSFRLLDTIEREAARINRTVDVLLEVHVAHEQTKSGFLPDELPTDLSAYPHVHVCGLMTMATNTDDEQEWRRCFQLAHSLLHTLPSTTTTYNQQPILSMGMSDDYLIAIEEGSTEVRIGSAIFGQRVY